MPKGILIKYRIKVEVSIFIMDLIANTQINKLTIKHTFILEYE